MFFKSFRDKNTRIFISWATGIVFFVALYAATGFWLVPYFLRTQLPAFVANEIQGLVRVADVRLNPFSGSLELDGVVLETLDQQPALAAERIRIDLAIWTSLATTNLVADGMADAADIRVNLGREGGSNWDKFFTDTEDPSTTMVPFSIRKFSIINSKLEFNDGTVGAVFSADRVSADLYDLGPDLAAPARLELQGFSGERTPVDLKAILKLSPTEINGIFHTENFNLKPVSAYLESSGIVLTKGELSGDMVLEYRSSGDSSVFLLKKSKLSLLDVKGVFRSDQTLNLIIDKLTLEELEYDGEKSTLGFGTVRLNTLVASGSEGVAIRVAGAELGTLSIDFSNLSAQAGSLRIDAVRASNNEKAGRIEATVDNIRSNSIKSSLDAISAAAIVVDKISLQDFSGAGNIPHELSIGKTTIQGLAGDIGKKFLSVDKLDSADAEVQAWVSERGVFGMPGYSGDEFAGKRSQVSQKPWAASLDEVLIHNYRFVFADHSVDPPVTFNLANLEARLTDLDTRQGKFGLRLASAVGKKGKIAVEGGGKVDPPEADLRVHLEGISLRPFRPYLNGLARIDLAKGKFNLSGDLTYRAAKNDIRFSGTAEVAGLVTLDKKEGRDFINWQSLRAEGLTLETAANRVSIRELIADKPYARVVVNRERTLNLIENLFQPKPKADPSRSAVPDEQALAITVGSLLVRDGSADFSDLSLQPNVSVDIGGLSGVIRPLSSKRDAKAEVLVKGSISDASPVTISGHINPFQFGAFADVSMRFANVDLTELSPYSAKFAGYRVEKGKVDLDLHYRLSDRKLVADNNMVFDHLTLGERVDSPDATSLPVKLAVSLMRGLDGKIDIDLPISGNLDDPEFSVTGLLAKAAVGVITKVIASPFSAIGVLLDGGGDDAGAIRFASGSSSLETPEKTKLDELAQALSKRPGLNLEIKGTARSSRDASALAEQQLRRQLENAKTIELRIGGGDAGAAGAVVVSEEDYRRLFSQFYRLRYPGASEWAELPKGERVLGAGLFESAQKKVLKDWSISEIDLRRLAQARAASTRSYLMQRGISANRIYLLDVELSGEDNGDAVAWLRLS